MTVILTEHHKYGPNYHTGHFITNRTDSRKKKFRIFKRLEFFLWHLLINLVDTCIGNLKKKKNFKLYRFQVLTKFD